MKVILKQHGDLLCLIEAIRVCHDSFDLMDSKRCDGKLVLGERDKKLIRGIIKNGHESTLEHIFYTFYIKGISRGCLQELVRHRIVSYSVQSTRYTLKKKLKNEKADFVKDENWYSLDTLEKYCVLTKDLETDFFIAKQMQNLKELINKYGSPNDMIKYVLPEAFKTDLFMTINARSLRNFFRLRISNSAHWEINHLAMKMYSAIPDEHDILYEDVNVVLK